MSAPSASGTGRERLLSVIEQDPGRSQRVSTLARLLALAVDDGDRDDAILEAARLDDVLPGRLLAMVNAMRQAEHGRPAGSLREAVWMLGFNTVRLLAVSLLVARTFEHMQADPAWLGEYRLALVAALIARDAAARRPSGREAAQVAVPLAMLRGVGRTLAAGHATPLHRQVLSLVRDHALDPDEAARRTLGIGYMELGLHALRAWKLEDPAVLAALQPIGSPVPSAGRRQWPVAAAAFAHALATVPRDAPDAGDRIARLFADFAAIQPPGGDDPADLLARRGDEADRLLRAAGLLAASLPRRAALSEEVADVIDGRQAARILSVATEELVTMVRRGATFHACARLAMEVLCGATGAARAVLAVRSGGTFGGVLAHGMPLAAAQRFWLPLDGGADLFHRALKDNRNFYVPDLAHPELAAMLPDWYRRPTGAMGEDRAFHLLPLAIDGQVFGFFYLGFKAVTASPDNRLRDAINGLKTRLMQDLSRRRATERRAASSRPAH